MPFIFANLAPTEAHASLRRVSALRDRQSYSQARPLMAMATLIDPGGRRGRNLASEPVGGLDGHFGFWRCRGHSMVCTTLCVFRGLGGTL